MKISIKQTLGLAAASCLALAGSALAKQPAGAGPGSHGNSSFGMSQRSDLRTGSGNSSYGRTTAENARLRSDADDDNDDQDVVRTKKVKRRSTPGRAIRAIPPLAAASE